MLLNNGFYSGTSVQYFISCTFALTSDSSSSINTSGDVLTFTDMSGVFYCVLFGMVGSLLVLLVELVIEAHKDTKQNKKEVFYSWLYTSNSSLSM